MQKVLKILIPILIVIITYWIIYLIASSKNIELVGGEAYEVKVYMPEYDAIIKMLSDMKNMGKSYASEDLERLLYRGNIWIAANLKGRQGVYVNTFGIIKRIYINDKALMKPVEFLDKIKFVDIDISYMKAFGYLNLIGTIFHEYIHYSETIDEKYAYNKEIAFYKQIKDTNFYQNLNSDEVDYYDWAIESSIKSTKEAKRKELQ